MIVKLLTGHHLEFLSFKGGCRGSSESTFVKIPKCWKSCVTAQLSNLSQVSRGVLNRFQVNRQRPSRGEAHTISPRSRQRPFKLFNAYNNRNSVSPSAIKVRPRNKFISRRFPEQPQKVKKQDLKGAPIINVFCYVNMKKI